MPMLEQIEREIETANGPKIFLISKFPAVAGREIIAQYPVSGMPKLGDYKVNEEIMLKLMSFVAVQPAEGPQLVLNSRSLIDNHVPDWETLARLEWAMMEYNCSFFRDGKVSNFLDDLIAKLPASIISILTPLFEQSSPKNQPPSTS